MFTLPISQSSVQLGLDFLSPESLAESLRLSEEIRGLPNDHDVKLQILEVRDFFYNFPAPPSLWFASFLPNEVPLDVCWLIQVGKISLYAASSAIKEVQKLVLDPKYVTYLVIFNNIFLICCYILYNF